MKILFVTNEIPFPPDNGVSIVSYNAMRLMSEAGHDLALAVLGQDENNIEYNFSKTSDLCVSGMSFYKELFKKNRWLVLLRSLVFNNLYPVERNHDKEFVTQLNKLITEFRPDVVHLDIITMIQYHKVIPTGVATVGSINDSYALALFNMLTNKSYSGLHYIYRLYQYFLARHYEKREYNKLTCMHLMTDIDADYLKKLNPEIETRAISNGVNPDLFRVSDSTISNNNLIFVAKLVGPNLRSLRRFLEVCWPEIHESSPDVKLFIVGGLNDESDKLKNSFTKEDNVIFTGYVEELKDVYSQCGIAIVPIDKNCGIINKAIEAMASGLAVIGFDKSFSGIVGAVKGTHFISVDDFSYMAAAINDLIADSDKCIRIKQAAFELAKQNFSWNSRLKKYEDMYKSSIERAINYHS